MKDRGLAPVAQAMYLNLEPAFAEYDKINFVVAQKYLEGQLKLKGAKLQKLQEAYTAIVNLKQAEPAVCALYRIGLRLPPLLRDAPGGADPQEDPRERRVRVEEYKLQLGTGGRAARAEGGRGARARDDQVARARGPERLRPRRDRAARQGEAREVRPDAGGVPALTAPVAEDAVKGYGFLTAVQPVAAPAPRAAGRARRCRPCAARLPRGALRRGRARREDAPGATDKSEQLPLPRSRRGGDDEDLLP